VISHTLIGMSGEEDSLTTDTARACTKSDIRRSQVVGLMDLRPRYYDDSILGPYSDQHLN